MLNQWLFIFGLALQFGQDVLNAVVEIAGDQPVTSPTIYTYLEGKKYGLVLVLTPVAGQARGNPAALNWLTVFAIVMQAAAAVEQDLGEVAIDAPFSTPPFDVTLEGYKYSVQVNGTPAS